MYIVRCASDDSESDKNLNFLLCLKLSSLSPLPFPPKNKKFSFVGAENLLLPLSSVKNFGCCCFICDAGHEAFSYVFVFLYFY
jgi:hypothetical protein